MLWICVCGCVLWILFLCFCDVFFCRDGGLAGAACHWELMGEIEK